MDSKENKKVKFINNLYANTTPYNVEIDGEYICCLTLSGDETNCKLSYIHGIGNLTNTSINNWKLVIDGALKKLKGCVFINTTNKRMAEFIRDNYITYCYNELPIGYNNGFQYHVTIKNDVNPSNYCRKPEILLVDKTIKENLKNKLVTFLKSKRRKADYVDELIDSL